MSTDPAHRAAQATNESPPSSASAGSPAQEDQVGAGDAPGQPSEEELRAAYEAEMSRISSAEMILQATVSLLNIGAYRLGLSGSAAARAGAGGESPEPTEHGSSASARPRELEQVRDAIDGARALLPILERGRDAGELRPLREALSQLQLGYAREAGAAAAAPGTRAAKAPGAEEPQGPAAEPESGERSPKQPGPAEASGRLWVPGR